MMGKAYQMFGSKGKFKDKPNQCDPRPALSHALNSLTSNGTRFDTDLAFIFSILEVV